MNLSLIIPVYNSSDILTELIKEIEKNINYDYEIILVNDFSKDSSWETIKKISKENLNIRGLNLEKNYGQHNAIAAGLYYSSGKYIILMDDDLQHDPRYINDILNELIKGYEACYVKYIKRKHKYWKKLVSQLNHLTSSFLSGKSLNIYTSSYKGFNRRICDIIKNDTKKEVFLDWIILNNSKKTNSIQVLHRKRYSGTTNYNLNKLLLLWSSMIMSIKSKNIISKLIINILKIFIQHFLFKVIKKKIFNEKFLISGKTF